MFLPSPQIEGSVRIRSPPSASFELLLPADQVVVLKIFNGDDSVASLVYCPATQLICFWIFICCFPSQNSKHTAGKSASGSCNNIARN